ncbi:fungal specific transcription factor domain-containingprotein [Penicillium pulvis]|uniref:fungal specific transcription factor domain-containingprotein n=1 Tax=Penicillium pulvis TaxID=1562058 RepID=UPI0025496BA6|nr:fungal specific transcription factor domain-containingprotein [Penicillium pulvis]KAJ5801899.1 fungal specific transcription factor domain-containingprotein [Penicillium pulvis]
MGTPDESPVLRPRLGRQRYKPQLSCNSCRQRKCVSPSCFVGNISDPENCGANARNDSSREEEKENIVKLTTSCNADQKSHLEPTCTYVNSLAPGYPSRQLHAISPTAQHFHEDNSTYATELGVLATPSSSASIASPETINLELTESGTGFKDPTHWTSVLSGVTEAKGQDDPSSSLDQNVLLFEGCKHATNQELLSSMPPRRESDGLVALYFRAQEYRSVIHPTEFLKRYNAFWENPSATSVTWLGLLYSIFCLTSQIQSQGNARSRAQNSVSSTWSPTALYTILGYRQKVVQCLVRAQFAKGGPDIMETLVHYLLIESYLNKDSNIGVWLLMGNIVQIAIRMGYHRDPQHFKSLSPYQGFASQMGLPGSIKHSLSDTMPPRNLQDRDFDASSTDLPHTRPIDELTSSTVILAKLHVATSLSVISDKVCSPHQLSHEDLIAAISTLDNMYETIPDPCKFRPTSESLLDPPSVLFQRMNFYMHYQRARILVNWKFLSTSEDTTRNNQSWSIVIEAALHIMRLQHRVADESEVFNTFRSTVMADSCFINNGYFLAASIACFLVQHRKDILSVQDTLEVRSLLEKSLAIWDRTSDLSREASRVVTALRLVLGNSEDTTIEARASPQAGGGKNSKLDRKVPDPTNLALAIPETFGRSPISFSSHTSFFDDLPLMMADDDTSIFLSLPSVPMTDYWPQIV